MPAIEAPTSEYIAYDREVDIMRADFDVNIFDVFRALPNINRFNGQTLRPYSVASHCLMCDKIANEFFHIDEPHLRLAILLHDAAEAYLGDIVRPIKALFTGFAELEEKIMQKVYAAVGFTLSELDTITDAYFQKLLHGIDTHAALLEADALTAVKILPHLERLPVCFLDPTEDPKEVKMNFTLKFYELDNKRKANED